MKKKKYVIVGTVMLLLGMVGVNAATSVPSNGVLYSNSNSSVTTVEGALNELYTNYNNLLTKGDASAANILTGKKVLVKGKEVTGTMANNGSVSKALAAGGSYTIPKGYHDGTGKVTANSLASQTSATATAAQILKGKTAYVNGSKVTGTMVDRGNAQTAGGLGCFPKGCGTGDSQYYALNNIPEGYYHKTSGDESWSPEIRINANQMRASLEITANKIAKGQTIAGITGTYTGLSVGGAVVHEKSVSNACGTDYYSTSSISVGTYIVTNVMNTNAGTGSASDMSVYSGATLLSEYKSGSYIVKIYKVVISSTIKSGTALGRMSNCSHNSGTSSMYGRSTWVKVSA